MAADLIASTGRQIETHAVSFLFVLTRASAAAVFLPLPWMRPAAPSVRAFLALGLAVLLFPVAGPSAGARPLSLIHLAGEAAIGLTIGAVIAWLNDIVLMAMQIVSSQAGFSFASTIDPATQADSTVLQLFGQIASGLFFVALGTDRELIGLLGSSLETIPPGEFTVQGAAVTAIAEWIGKAAIYSVRLSLPVVVMLALADIVLSMTARLQPQLQLLTLAFPVKILASIVILAATAGITGRLLIQAHREALSIATGVLR